METGDMYAGVKKIEDKLWPTLKVNWVVWPVLQAVNLSVVPLQYRILYINFCSIFWSAYLSNMASSKAPAAAISEIK
jgi:Mpv17 / PMP22 family